MQIVINIPEDEYKKICNGDFDTTGYFRSNLSNAFINGTPIPIDTVDRATIKEYLDSYNNATEIKVGKIGKDTITSELSSIRHELLERKDELVSFGQLIERFDDVDAEYGGSPWTLEQIYANFNVLMGIESAGSLSYNGVKTELSGDADCIRRSDVGLTDFEILMCNGDYKEALKILLDKIEKAPPVTPQPKIGRWIVKSESWCCSCCNEPVCEIYDGTPYQKFCPNCGCKMQEVE